MMQLPVLAQKADCQGNKTFSYQRFRVCSRAKLHVFIYIYYFERVKLDLNSFKNFSKIILKGLYLIQIFLDIFQKLV